jgi:hypothetical protein
MERICMRASWKAMMAAESKPMEKYILDLCRKRSKVSDFNL